MKDLGKSLSCSPKQDKNVLEMFATSPTKRDEFKMSGRGTSEESGGVGSGSSCGSSSEGDRTDDDDGSEQKFTDSVMDRHLFALEADGLNMEDQNTACDIVKYMANLKRKHMEAEQQHQQNQEGHAESSSDTLSRSNSSDKGSSDSQLVPPMFGDDTPSSESETIAAVVIDNKVDKVFTKSVGHSSKKENKPKADKNNKSHTLQSPSTSSSRLLSQSPDRTRSNVTSPVRIIKIKSPRNSIADGNGKRLSVSRDSSRDKSPDRRDVSPRRQTEGGILKRSLSPKPDGMPPAMGILKRCRSPTPKSGSSDRSSGSGYTRRSLSAGQSMESQSSRGSFDSRSPDRSRLNSRENFQSPTCSFDSRASEPNLDIPRSVLKTDHHRGSFDSRTPDQSARKRSLSAHSSLDKTKSSEPYYHYYYQLYQQQQQQLQQMSMSPDRRQRLSKSLERSGSKDSSTSTGSYRYGLSPERIYQIGPPVVRSQSAENAYLRQDSNASSRYDISQSNESLTKSIEHPTCVECLYQRKPS